MTQPRDPELAIAAALSQVPVLAGHKLHLESLTGALARRAYQVTAGDARYVVRLRGPDSGELLPVDRDAEWQATLAAAEAGVAPAVVAYLPADALLLTDWIAGRTLTDADLGDPAQLARVAATCRRLHAGPALNADLELSAIRQRYLATAKARRVPIPDGYLDWAPQARRIERVLRATAVPAVPCHGDLSAANIVDDGQRLWFIDYEFAGNADPCFELGNLGGAAQLSAEAFAVLADCYFGRRSPVMTARCRLYALLSQYVWVLWGWLGAAAGDIGFDSRQWGLARYARVCAEFAGAELAGLLSTARGPD